MGLIVFLMIAGAIGWQAVGMARVVYSEGGTPIHWLLFALMLTPVTLLALFFVSGFVLHGDALTGKIVAGHYFVNNRGDYTEVSRRAYDLSFWLGRVTIGSFLVALAASILASLAGGAKSVWRRLRRDSVARTDE